ncbi:PEP-CTERM sorting domain-containing protein [Kiritimatiellota bacterium B12222]|nr:PEP-CTERM sorting domain-containing protein [Kiritimatiellota bacterium B12222]
MKILKLYILPLLFTISLSSASAGVVMLDFNGTGGDAGPTASATDISTDGGFTIDSVIANTGSDIASLSVGTETLSISFSGVTAGRDRGTDKFTDSTTGDVLTPYFRDMIFNSGGTLGITVSGLTIGNQYQFYFHAVDADFTRTIPVTSLGNSGAPLSVGTVSYTISPKPELSSFSDYQVNTGLYTATGASETFSITGGTSNVNALAAMTIVTIPEPSSMVLVGIAASGLIFLRRRRR